jgi:hypothetical protein
MGLASKAGLRKLADERMSVPTDKGANAGLKLSSLIARMAAGADSIDDMALLRHGGMGKVFTGAYAPSTLGSFLRSFTFGHVRQADAVASRFLLNLAEHTGLLGGIEDSGPVIVDIDDTIVEVHGYHKQGAAFGYSGMRGLNALLATVSTEQIAPVIAAQRLRKGSVGSPRGAVRLATDTLALIRRSRLAGRDVLVRADSAFYSHALVTAVLTAGAVVSITVRMDPAVTRAIAGIAENTWTTIKYTDAIYDQTTQFAVVVLDPPADLGQSDQLGQRRVLGQGREPVVGGLGGLGRPVGQQPHRRQRAVFGQPSGWAAASRADPQHHEVRGHRPARALSPGQPQRGRAAGGQHMLPQGERSAAVARLGSRPAAGVVDRLRHRVGRMRG